MAQHNYIGTLGEDIAAKWLVSKKYLITERNYRKKWGEIDLIGSKDNKVHFIEVKTVSYETRKKLEYAVSHETWRPEEKVTPHKLKKLLNTIETWLSYKHESCSWQLDVVTVRVVPREKYAAIKLIENVILE